LCLERGYVVPVEGRIDTYFCNYGKTFHSCNGVENCPITLITKEGNIVCLISGKDLGPKIEYKCFGKPDVGKPQEDGDFVQNNDDQDCDVSDVSDTDRNDDDDEDDTYEGLNRQEKTKNEKKVKNRRCFDINNPNLAANAKGIIKCILFDNIREKVNQKDRSSYSNHAISCAKKEYKRCNRENVRPNRFVIDSYYDHAMSNSKSVPVAKYDSKKLYYYTQVVVKMWKLIMSSEYFNKNHSSFHFHQHILGCLYIMSEGLKYKQDSNGTAITIFEKVYLRVTGLINRMITSQNTSLTKIH